MGPLIIQFSADQGDPRITWVGYRNIISLVSYNGVVVTDRYSSMLLCFSR